MKGTERGGCWLQLNSDYILERDKGKGSAAGRSSSSERAGRGCDSGEGAGAGAGVAAQQWDTGIKGGGQLSSERRR